VDVVIDASLRPGTDSTGADIPTPGQDGDMTLVVLDPGSDEAPYEQLRRQIAAQVSTGLLPPGQKLPTVRALAAELGLAINTVARSYRELEADGVITTEGRRGTYVRGETLDDTVPDVRAAVHAYAAAARREGLSLSEAVRVLEQAWAAASR
jgi:DNA-binding transcriptional regulator YhcF (GntR family)